MNKTLIIVTMMTFLSGCMSQMVQPDGALPSNFEIRSVSVKPYVTIVAKPFVQTAGQIWGGAIGGLIGAAIASEATPEGQLTALMDKGNVDLKSIVYKTFKEQLASSHTKIKLAKKSADVSIQLQVLFYGIHPDGPFSSAVEPMLEVGGQVFDSNGKHILNVGESLKFPSDEEVKSYEMEEYVAKPKLLADGFKSLSRIIANAMIQQLENPHAN